DVRSLERAQYVRTGAIEHEHALSQLHVLGAGDQRGDPDRAHELEAREVHDNGRVARDRQRIEPKSDALVPLDVHAAGEANDAHTIPGVFIETLHAALRRLRGPRRSPSRPVPGSLAVHY